MVDFTSPKNLGKKVDGTAEITRKVPNAGPRGGSRRIEKSLSPAANAADVFSVEITAGEDGKPIASPAIPPNDNTSANDAKE